MGTVKVAKVLAATVQIQKANPPILSIDATGEVTTLGYTNGRLEPYIYVHPPLDGIWDFDFYADEPSGPAGDQMSEISTMYEWSDYPKDLKGVRIHGQQGSKEAMLS